MFERLPEHIEPLEEGEEAENFAEKLQSAMKGIAPSLMESCLRSKTLRLSKSTQGESTNLEEFAAWTRTLAGRLANAITAQELRLQGLHEQLRSAAPESAMSQENGMLNEQIQALRRQLEEAQVHLAEKEKEAKDQKSFATSARDKLIGVVLERDQLEAKLALAERKLDKLGSSLTATAPSAAM